jgi:sirohydrochlorin cobaltochelatase
MDQGFGKDDSQVVVLDLSNAALALLGHGSTVNAQSGAPVFQHCAELRRRKLFAEVREAFWKQEPQVKQVLFSLTAHRVFIVPLFISEGHFSEAVIPRELGFAFTAGQTTQVQRAAGLLAAGPRRPAFVPGQLTRVQRRGPQTLLYCKPIGTHESMTQVLLARAREVVEQFPFPRAPKPADCWLFIAGHGTEINENSRKAIERQVELIRGMNLYAGVDGVFLDEEPRISNCYELTRVRNIIVVPFFISDGMHTQEDIPVLLGEPERIVRKRIEAGQPAWRNPTEKKGKLVWYGRSVGTEPQLAEVVLERVREAAEWE